MVEPSKPTTIVVKRIKKGDHAHHGGAWKIAYADFVTAMMAFFFDALAFRLTEHC